MATYGKAAQEHIKTNLDRIESTLATLHALMEQEQADADKADWGVAGELGYIASQLEEVETFWSNNEVEAR